MMRIGSCLCRGSERIERGLCYNSTMTLTISLPADAEARLRQLAEAAGKDVSAYAAELVAAAGSEQPTAADIAEFQQLLRQWKEDTEFLSASSEIAMHPAYQRIMAMG